MTDRKRTDHRATVWARGKNGVPVSCTCGWKVHAFTVMGAKREHIAATKDDPPTVAGFATMSS